MWLIIFALVLIAGLRGQSVGIDTSSYLEKFEYISKGLLQYAYGLETSFKLICQAVLKLVPSGFFLLALLAFITHSLVIFRLWELRKVSNFSTMVACYYMAFFFMSMNAVRQFCAMAILFYATRFLVKHRVIRFAAGVALASLFHQSAVIGVGLVAFDLLRWSELRDRYRLLLLGIAACSPVLLVWVMRRMSFYEKYLDVTSANIGLIVPMKILFFLFCVLFVFWFYGKNHHFPSWKELDFVEKNSAYLTCICYALGLCLMFASYFIPMMNRLGWYFSLFECVFMGILTKTNHRFHRLFFTACAWALVGFGFIMAMIGDHQGTMPYLFVWQ